MWAFLHNVSTLGMVSGPIAATQTLLSRLGNLNRLVLGKKRRKFKKRSTRRYYFRVAGRSAQWWLRDENITCKPPEQYYLVYCLWSKPQTMEILIERAMRCRGRA